jgi:hypothetical protein
VRDLLTHAASRQFVAAAFKIEDGRVGTLFPRHRDAMIASKGHQPSEPVAGLRRARWRRIAGHAKG